MKLKYLAGLTGLLMLAGCDAPNVDESVNEPTDMLAVSTLQQQFEAEVGHEGNWVFFGFDQYNVTAAQRAKLQKQVEWLNQHPEAMIQVEGHCDERGTSEYNMGLGMRRAESVVKVMKEMGLTCANVSVISYGKERPAVPGTNEAAHAKNRRAVTVVTMDIE